MILNTQLASEYKRQYDPKHNMKMNIFINEKLQLIEMDVQHVDKDHIYNIVACYENVEKMPSQYKIKLFLAGIDSDKTILENILTENGDVEFTEASRPKEMNVQNLYCAMQHLVDKMKNERVSNA